MIRRILEGFARLPGIATFILPLLKFLFNIDWIKDLERFPLVEKFSSFLGLQLIHILGVIGVLYIIAKLALYYIDRNECSKAGSSLHDFFHVFRNNLIEITNKSEKDYLSSEDGLESFYGYVKDKSEMLCSLIAEFLKEFTHKDFGVCIKFITPTSSSKSASKKEIELMTLCRAGSKRIERESNDFNQYIKLTDNTDFEMIFDSIGNGGSNIFATHNLFFYMLYRLIKGTPYKTSSINPLKKYMSTIVVPIRISNRHLPRSWKSCAVDCTLIGFLCIDYRWPLRRSEIKLLKDYIKAIGDSLYPFFDNVIRIDRCIKKSRNLLHSG